MNKADLLEALLRVLSTRKEANDAINTIFNSMTEALKRKEKVVVSGFGSFNIRLAHARKFRVPKTGESVTVAARPKIKFKPSKELLKELV